MAHLGKNQKHLLDFANKYPQHWHTYKHKCAATKSAVNSLAEMGIIEIDKEFHQFRLKNRPSSLKLEPLKKS